MLVLTKSDRGLLGATAEVNVRHQTSVPGVGERPPTVSTDTIASAGSEAAVDTRVPAAPELHKTNFGDVLGKRPVALLFAPQLCQSRVCDPWPTSSYRLNIEAQRLLDGLGLNLFNSI